MMQTGRRGATVCAMAAVIALVLAVSPAESQRAAQLAHRCIVEYNASDFANALADAKAAYELDPRPALLYNLGQCYRALGDLRQALFSYRRYLREEPDASNRAMVKGLIAGLEGMVKQEPASPNSPSPAAAPSSVVVVAASPPAAAPAGAVSEEEPRRGLPGRFWWLGGSAVATGAAGTILGVISQAALANDHSFKVDGFEIHSLSEGSYQAAQYEGLTADILWGVGGALLVSAVIVVLTK